MKRKILLVALAVILVLSMVGCGAGSAKKSITDVNVRVLKTQDLGSMMPKILFAHNDKIAFWGSFGLFIISGEDASIYRAVDLAAIGYGNMTGEVNTVFVFSENYDTIYFYNEDDNGENVEEFYYAYVIEEDKVRQIPKDVEVAILPDQPAFSLNDLAGGEPTEGYSSNPVFYGENSSAYLHSKNWIIADLELVIYNLETEEAVSMKIFD